MQGRCLLGACGVPTSLSLLAQVLKGEGLDWSACPACHLIRACRMQCMPDVYIGLHMAAAAPAAEHECEHVPPLIA